MFPKAEKAEKSCCQNNGECQRPTENAPAKECKRMAIEPHGFSSALADIAVVAVLTDDIVLPSLDASSAAHHPETPIFEHSPPDLNVLHSTFII
jgi:hypothetical protein